MHTSRLYKSDEVMMMIMSRVYINCVTKGTGAETRDNN